MSARIFPGEARVFRARNLEMAMDVKKLLTLTFDRNVGPLDRVFRLLSGAALAAAGWVFGAPPAAAIAMTALGLLWSLTGLLSKCSIYYMLGYSTCPVSGQTFPGRS